MTRGFVNGSVEAKAVPRCRLQTQLWIGPNSCVEIVSNAPNVSNNVLQKCQKPSAREPEVEIANR
jgi:hypothetical protein